MFDFNTAPRALKVVDPQAWEGRLERLRETLAQRADTIVADVFPRARIHAGEARIGSVDGEPGESLAISLMGDRAGLWTDHATGEGGDLIDLWRQTQNCEFIQAVDDLERWCGLSSAPRFTSPVARVAEKRKAEAAASPRPERPALGAPVASWHYYDGDGQLIGIVRRYDLPDIDAATGKPKKTFLQFNARGEAKSPDVRPLYRLPQIKGVDTVVLVEGEKCADKLASIGIEATSVMGGSNSILEKTDLTPLAGKTVILWPDNDGPGKTEAKSYVGQKYMARLKPLLEALGCRVALVEIPAGKPEKWDAADAIEDGTDVTALVSAAYGTLTAPPAERRKLQILSLSQLAAVEPPKWLVAGVLPQGGFAGLYGAPGAAKSFVAVDIAMHIATGRAWHGREVEAGYVLYIMGEGQAGAARRLLGWLSAKDMARDAVDQTFGLLPRAVAMPTGELGELLQAIAEMPRKPALIVLDTLARTFGAGDENNQKDMNAYVGAIDKLREETGAAVLVIHHTGKDEAKGARGSTAFTGAVDSLIYVKRKGPAVTLVNKAPHGKQKDAEEFEDIELCSRQVEFDHQGQRVTTLVLQKDAAVVGDDTEEAKPVQRLGPLQKKIMSALELAARDGQTLGFTRILALVGGDRGNLGKCLRNMVENGLIDVSGETGNQQWGLA